MKIEEQNGGTLGIGPKPTAGAARANAPAGVERSDAKRVAGPGPAVVSSISARGRELAAAMAAAASAPDVREALVAEIRARLADGTHQVDPEDIARRILGE